MTIAYALRAIQCIASPARRERGLAVRLSAPVGPRSVNGDLDRPVESRAAGRDRTRHQRTEGAHRTEINLTVHHIVDVRETTVDGDIDGVSTHGGCRTAGKSAAGVDQAPTDGSRFGGSIRDIGVTA